MSDRVEISRPRLECGFDSGAHFRRLLDPLAPQRNLATMARVLVDAERDRSLLTTIHGSGRLQVSTDIGGSNGRFGSHHVHRERPSETLDCRPGARVQVRALRRCVVQSQEHPAAVWCGR